MKLKAKISIYRLILISLFFMSVSAESQQLEITIKNNSPSSEEFSFPYPVFHTVNYSFFPVLIKAFDRESESERIELSHTCKKTVPDTICFKLETGELLTLPDKVSRRLLNLISSGWGNYIKLPPELRLPRPDGSHFFDPSADSPTCCCLMYYIGIGIRCCSSAMIEAKARSHIYEENITMTEFTSRFEKSLAPGDMVMTHNLDFDQDNHAYIYLGSSLFLAWSRGYKAFYIKHASHIDLMMPAEPSIQCVRNRQLHDG